MAITPVEWITKLSNRDKQKYNDYHREYQLNRYHERRAAAIEQLGGKCVKCGIRKDLQIDHTDPTQKSFTLSQYWGASEQKFQAELSKCQVLCQPCHAKKSAYDTGKRPARHGSIGMHDHHGCRCPPCKSAKRKLNKKWSLIRGEKRKLLRVWKKYTVSMAP